MEGMIFAALTMMTGAAVFDVWGFLQAKKAADATATIEKFDWIITLTTVAPSLVLAVGAGLAMNVQMPVGFANIVTQGFTLVSSGFGLAAAQGKLGLNSFFRSPPQ